MPAQVQDSIIYGDDSFSIISSTDTIGFHPDDYHMTTAPITSLCLRGYNCEYEIQDGLLYLNDLMICTRDRKYPLLNGIPPELNDFGALYKKIGLPVLYTGKILAGANLISKYFVNVGTQRYYAYRKVIEFSFENGKLVRITDQSEQAEQVHKQIGDIQHDQVRS